MFRSVLTRFLYEFEPDIFSLIFTWFLVIRNLNSVPGLRILSMNQRLEVIKSLNLSRVTLTGSALVARSIHQLQELQVFHYMGDCTDEVVIQLGLNCPNLTVVSVMYSFRVTNDCVPHLLLLSNLEFLDITGTQIDRLHYGQLLSGLPKISNVRFVNKLDDLLSHIALETVDTVTQVYGVVNDINNQIRKFPKTQKFVLIEPDVHLPDVTPPPDFDLSDVTHWTELRKLEILFGDCTTINLNAILTGIGHVLTDLTLKSVTDLNHGDIITLCKSLGKSISAFLQNFTTKCRYTAQPRVATFHEIAIFKNRKINRRSNRFQFYQILP
ncbi:uncharacterized protein LOC111867374 [Cryptotermes secundus]|uniref:uncharacterized protein LOC111867374 n=1 Tax=Cryptotermes secundus TaxID=105785 RepID=UPI000CD7B52D|nr:uncharacterized protein LOC111867374 [Cryptotermes secundus]